MAIPPTSYMLNAIREAYIKYADPSEMGKDLYDGLKEKERDLAGITHESLAADMDDYLEMEAEIASTIKDGLTALLIGTKGPDDLEMTLPEILFSGFMLYGGSSSSSSSSSTESNVNPGKSYLLVTEISGGNVGVDQFTYEWTIASHPELPNYGEAHLSELFNEISNDVWQIGTIVDFTVAGSYTLQLTITHKLYSSMQIVARASVDVIDE